MKTNELIKKIQWVTKKGTGTYEAAMEYRHRVYKATFNESMLYDAYQSCEPHTSERCCGYTFRQAVEQIWRIVKRSNNLR